MDSKCAQWQSWNKPADSRWDLFERHGCRKTLDHMNKMTDTQRLSRND